MSTLVNEQKQVKQQETLDFEKASIKVNQPDLMAAREALREQRAPTEARMLLAEKYTTPNPYTQDSGTFRVQDAQANAVREWLRESRLARSTGEDVGAIVFQDVNGYKIGLHHAGSPAPSGTHYNISCFSDGTQGRMVTVGVGADNPFDPVTSVTFRKN